MTTSHVALLADEELDNQTKWLEVFSMLGITVVAKVNNGVFWLQGTPEDFETLNERNGIKTGDLLETAAKLKEQRHG
jgi:hypothetical protein